MSKILIVDDDPHIRELSSLFLRNDGFEVYEASDGADALLRLNTIKVDLFIIDIMMPNMDGWELCRELRAAYDLPILMLTARAETNQKLKGFQFGFGIDFDFENRSLVFELTYILSMFPSFSEQHN